MAAGKGFWGKLGTSMKNVTPEQWKAGARITDKFSGGATGYLGTAIAESKLSLDGKFRKKDRNTDPVNQVNNNNKKEAEELKNNLKNLVDK